MIYNRVEIYSIEPKYQKDNGLVLQDIDRPDLPLGFQPVSRSLVTIPPGEIGGNHAHLRKEAFIGVGEGLEIFWLDENGSRHSEQMNPNGKLKLFVVDTMVPHAIRNNADSPAVILEYADMPQEQSPVEPKQVLE